MIDPPLKYVDCAVTLAEVPEEISLTFSISNCAYQCHGCHSAYLQKDIGIRLLDDLEDLIQRYAGQITCVCLMGEGRNPRELGTVLMTIRKHGQKTCLYSGCDHLDAFTDVQPLLDYLKIGSYDERVGGLDQPQTNQRFFKNQNGVLIDQTHRFQRKREQL